MKKLTLALTAWLLAASVASAQVVTGSVPNTFINGTIIDATQVNADYTYIINQVNANAAKNGVNNDITALSVLSTPLSPVQSGSNIYYAGYSVGTANAAVITAPPTPANFTLAYGKTVRYLSGATNTGPATIAVNGLAATAIVKQTPNGLSALTGGELAANNLIELFYDGTQFEIMNASAENGGFSSLTAMTGSATPDLGTMPSHNINLLGGPFTITSFGSTATLTYPIYLIRFNAANILVQSASFNLLGGVSRLTAATDQALYFYNGSGVWNELAYFPAATKVAATGASNLTVKNNAITPNTQVDITATEVVMDSAFGSNTYTDSYGTCTINFGVPGAGGLDTGAIAANTWYYFYAISSGIVNSCLASTSSTAPTMPAGYTYKVRVGANRTSSAAATLWPVYQQGAKAQFSGVLAVPFNQTVGLFGGGLAVGTCGTTPQTMATMPTMTGGAVWGGMVPITARAADFNLLLATAGTMCVAAFSDTGNLPANSQCAIGNLAGGIVSMPAEINYMGIASPYMCVTNSTSQLTVSGWVDHVNAN